MQIQIQGQSGQITNVENLHGGIIFESNIFNLQKEAEQAKSNILAKIDALDAEVSASPNLTDETKRELIQAGNELKTATQGGGNLIDSFKRYGTLFKEYTRTISDCSGSIKTLVEIGKSVGALIALIN